MASQQTPAGRTTIAALGDDLLRGILLRLPDLPCLRSFPTFRRSFRALHAPPLVALFLKPNMEAVPVLRSRSRRSDPGLLAADFFGINLSLQGDPCATGWDPSGEGYLILMGTGSTDRRVDYSPLTQALGLFIYQPDYVSFEFYTVSSEDGQGPSRVVCVRHERRLAESTAVVFSSDTMEWQISRKSTLPLREPEKMKTGMVVRGLICWQEWMYDQIVLLDTTTCQFSLIDLPAFLKTEDESTYKLGETKDEKFCIVDIKEVTLVSWFLTADDDNAVERWMVYKKFSLHPIVKEFTGCSMEEEGCHVRVGLVAVIDGFVYLSIYYCKDTKHFEVYISLCLETSEISELFNGAYRDNVGAYPYVMGWPPSLLQSKEEPETEFTGDNVADDGPVCTEEASAVLVTALQSFRQALMNDSDSNKEIAAELDAFFGPTEDDEGSIVRKLTTLDAQLKSARDRILRMRASL